MKYDKIWQEIRVIYQHLGDEESKEIYANRLLYSMTGNRKYMLDTVRNTAAYQTVYKTLLDDKREKVIVGAGYWGKIFADLYTGIKFSRMIDNYVTGNYNGLPIVSLEEYQQNMQDDSFYVTAANCHEELCQMIRSMGIEESRIVDVTGIMLDIFHHLQYFDLPYLNERKEEKEIFVDGGCFDGFNSLRFAEWAGKSGEKIYAFEPDGNNAGKCAASLEGCSLPYNLIPKGLWNCDTTLQFQARGNEASNLASNGELQVDVTSIDNAIEGAVTFIKMDIEGAEYEALRGAENKIRQFKPKLAVSVYHRPEDIWELPQVILSYCPDYKLYLRHYSLDSAETVLYAI